MLSKINPMFDIPQRLAAVTIEKKFEKLKSNPDFEADVKEVGFIEILAAEFFNLWVNQQENPNAYLKEDVACIGAIALRWLSDLYQDEFGK